MHDFTRNDYLEWYVPKVHGGAGAINLHASGVRPLAAEDLIHGLAGDPWGWIRDFSTALAAWLNLPGDQVLPTPGATGGNLLAFMGLTRPGARVLVEAPIYEPMVRQAFRTNQVKRFLRRFDQGWRLPLDQVEALLDEDTDLVLITEPHNPSGIMSPREDILRLAKAAARVGAVVLVNEVYLGYTEQPSCHGLADNIVTLGSFSKLAGAYWARLGWLTANPEVISRLRGAQMNSSMLPAPSAGIGLALMDRISDLTARARSLASQPLPLVESWAESRRELGWMRPQGPGFAAIKLPLGLDDRAFGEYLLREKGVFTVPGSWFEAAGTLRISWLQAGEDLERGLALIGEGLDDFS